MALVAQRWPTPPEEEPPSRAKRSRSDNNPFEVKGEFVEARCGCMVVTVDLTTEPPQDRAIRRAFEALPGRYWRVLARECGLSTPLFRQERPKDADAPNEFELFMVMTTKGWWWTRDPYVENIESYDGVVYAWAPIPDDHKLLPECAHVPYWSYEPNPAIGVMPYHTYLENTIKELHASGYDDRRKGDVYEHDDEPLDEAELPASPVPAHSGDYEDWDAARATGWQGWKPTKPKTGWLNKCVDLVTSLDLGDKGKSVQMALTYKESPLMIPIIENINDYLYSDEEPPKQQTWLVNTAKLVHYIDNEEFETAQQLARDLKDDPKFANVFGHHADTVIRKSVREGNTALRKTGASRSSWD